MMIMLSLETSAKVTINVQPTWIKQHDHEQIHEQNVASNEPTIEAIVTNGQLDTQSGQETMMHSQNDQTTTTTPTASQINIDEEEIAFWMRVFLRTLKNSRKSETSPGAVARTEVNIIHHLLPLFAKRIGKVMEVKRDSGLISDYLGSF